MVCSREGAGQFRRLRTWRECAGAHQALGMRRPEAGVQAEELVESVEQLFGKGQVGISAGRHGNLLDRQISWAERVLPWT